MTLFTRNTAALFTAALFTLTATSSFAQAAPAVSPRATTADLARDATDRNASQDRTLAFVLEEQQTCLTGLRKAQTGLKELLPEEGAAERTLRTTGRRIRYLRRWYRSPPEQPRERPSRFF